MHGNKPGLFIFFDTASGLGEPAPYEHDTDITEHPYQIKSNCTILQMMST